MVKKKYNVLDLFCGCGGLSLGFENAGFNVLLGIDMWEDALVTYRRNHKNSNTLCADLATLPVEEVDKSINHEKVDVIIGGPPCQGFSIAGKRIVEDDRNKLYKSFVSSCGGFSCFCRRVLYYIRDLQTELEIHKDFFGRLFFCLCFAGSSSLFC